MYVLMVVVVFGRGEGPELFLSSSDEGRKVRALGLLTRACMPAAGDDAT